MTNKKKKRIREHAQKTGMTYQASLNALSGTTLGIAAETGPSCEGEVLDTIVRLKLESRSHRHFMRDLYLSFDVEREEEITQAVRSLVGSQCVRILIGQELNLSPRGLSLAPRYRGRVLLLSAALLRYVQEGIRREGASFDAIACRDLEASGAVSGEADWALFCVVGWCVSIFSSGATTFQRGAVCTLTQDRQELRKLAGSEELLQCAQRKWIEETASARRAHYLDRDFHSAAAQPEANVRESASLVTKPNRARVPSGTARTFDSPVSRPPSATTDDPSTRPQTGPKRDGFSQKTLDVLAKRVGSLCSNPACQKPTTGPRTEAGRIICIGVGAHITAASPGGPRYDASLSSEQRSSVENGIWLCQNDAKLVDNDEARYTTALLREWKQTAEAAARAGLEGPSSRLEVAAELELAVGGIQIPTAIPLRPSKTYTRSGYCYRHDYELSIAIRNLGDERLDGYHLDLEFPAAPIEKPQLIQGYLSDKSSETRLQFRALSTAQVFPGDSVTLLKIPYYVDDAMHRNHRRPSPEYDDVYVHMVRAKLYRSGLKPLVVELPFADLQNF